MGLKKPETCKAEVNREINKKNLCFTLDVIQFPSYDIVPCIRATLLTAKLAFVLGHKRRYRGGIKA
jgi:hypothetical protein